MEYLIALTFFLAPAYIMHFTVHGLPTNLLMVWIGVVWIVFVIWLAITHQVKAFFRSIPTVPKPARLFVELFLLAGTIALFIGGFSQAKLAQYIVWFIQPLSLFYIVRYVKTVKPRLPEFLAYAFYVFVAISGLYAIYQYFTLHGLPADWWGNAQEPKRAISFFVHPNDYALFVTPLLAFLIPDVMQRLKSWRSAAWLMGAAGLLLSLSRGGWFGLAASVVVFVAVVGAKKYWKQVSIAAVALVIIVVAVPNLRWRVILPFYGERSASARSVLWESGWHMVKDNPIVGKGLLGADHNWNTYAVDPSLGHYPFPHNIFLDFWIDTGLLGLASFIALALYGLWCGIKNKSNIFALGLALFLVALLVHGQIDNPYFKNDLALVFWLVWAMSI